MKVIDIGNGPPLVLIPGLQGRWEYLAGAVRALAVHYRVLTFSLPDERTFAPSSMAGHPLDGFVDAIEHALDARGIQSATICGVSFGGRVALRFAARRPERTNALLLVSTPGPNWHLRQAHRDYARSPWKSAPLFFFGATERMLREIGAVEHGVVARVLRTIRVVTMILMRPSSPARMASRALMIDGMSSADDSARVVAPTLVLNGEPELDHVVPVSGSSEYTRLISRSQSVTFSDTGHQGTILRPMVFARLVHEYLQTLSITDDSNPARTHDAA